MHPLLGLWAVEVEAKAAKYHLHGQPGFLFCRLQRLGPQTLTPAFRLVGELLFSPGLTLPLSDMPMERWLPRLLHTLGVASCPRVTICLGHLHRETTQKPDSWRDRPCGRKEHWQLKKRRKRTGQREPCCTHTIHGQLNDSRRCPKRPMGWKSAQSWSRSTRKAAPGPGGIAHSQRRLVQATRHWRTGAFAAPYLWDVIPCAADHD